MKVDRRLLHGALSHLVHVADPKAALPIYGHVLLESRDSMLTITATDGTTTVGHEMSAEGELFITLPVKMLHVLVKPEGRSDAGDVEIEKLDDNHASVVTEGLSTKLATMDPTDFPPVPGDAALDWSLLAMCPAQPIREALDYVLPAASTDEARPHLNCVCLDAGEMLATDGHRLHSADIPTHLTEPLLLSFKAARIMKRLLSGSEQVIFARAKDIVRVRVGQWQMDTRLVEARFPPVEKVIPSRDQPVRISVEQFLLTKALTRVAKLSRDNNVRMTVNGEVQLTAEHPDLGEAQVIVPVVENNHEGEDLITGFNLRYLRDATATKEETVELRLSGPGEALRVDGEGKLAVVMPMRL